MFELLIFEQQNFYIIILIIKSITMSSLKNTLISLWIVSIVIVTFVAIPQESTAKPGLFKSKSELSLKSDKGCFENLSLNEEVMTNLTIVYSYGRFSIPAGALFLAPSPTKIHLKVLSKPKWCEVKIENENLSVDMPLISILGGEDTLETQVTIKVISKDAPGYQEGKIVIKAEAEENGNIESSEAQCEIKVKPGFYPDVEVNKSYFRLELAPGEESEISIEITNNGNMEIVASVETPEEIPDMVILDLNEAKSIDVKPGKSKTIKIGIEIKDYEGKIDERYSIPLEISYHAKDYENLKGESISVKLNLRIKGEPKSIFSGSNLVFIESAVIIALIIALIVVIIRRRA